MLSNILKENMEFGKHPFSNFLCPINYAHSAMSWAPREMAKSEK